MSGRKRDIGRQYASGSVKRKAREGKEKRENKILSKIPKLTDLFRPTVASTRVITAEVSPASSEVIQTVEVTGTELESEDIQIRVVQDSQNSMSTDIGEWPNFIDHHAQEYWISKGSGECQHIDTDFTTSGRTYENESKPRYCQKSFFTMVHKLTNERRERHWLCYSVSTGCLFCFTCKVMCMGTSQLVNEGFNDWKNANNNIKRHEDSTNHRQAIVSILARKYSGKRVDSRLVNQMDEDKIYWSSVLERVIETVRFLAERGLAFRGSDEIIGSPHNGNFLGVLELLSKFDPFLAQHINIHSKKGKGHTSYLSKTTYEEFIDQLGSRILDLIVEEVKKYKYYSVSLDSTPDVSHIDQLTLVFRYVLPSGPVERFVTFLDMEGHSGNQLAHSLFVFLEKHGIDVKNCRGQAYDNASNMSGKYKGMQARICQVNKYADYVPCAGHSLNLVGQHAAGCCLDAVSYFDFLQNLYAFFSASTHRWSLLLSALSSYQLPVLKRMSDTRWSARADATNAVLKGYNKIKDVLDDIAVDTEQKADSRLQARGLVSKMDQLETGILTVLWHKVLDRFHITSLTLQAANQDLNTACALFESLLGFIIQIRPTFSEIEQNAKDLTDCTNYKQDVQRVRNRNRKYDDDCGSAASKEVIQTPAEKFRTGTFIVIIDSLYTELTKRLSAYQIVSTRFVFLGKLLSLSREKILEKASELVLSYPEDLENSFPTEIIHFSELLKTELGKGKIESPEDVAVELKMYLLITENGLEGCFPNMEIALRIYLTLMVTNCTGERSFSKLKRIKDAHRSTMGQNRLNNLTLMSIENELLRQLDISAIIKDFSLQKSRKVNI